MGNFMIGNFYPSSLGRIDKIMCGGEQCWPTTNVVIPQGGFGIYYNGEMKEFFAFNDAYDNYTKLAIGDYNTIERRFEIEVTKNIIIQIVGRCSVYKSTDGPVFECDFVCWYMNQTTGVFTNAEYYCGYAETSHGIELTDLDKVYIWNIYGSQASMTTTLKSADKTLYKNYGSIYIVRERDWNNYNSHQLITSYSLLNEFLPLWDAGSGSSVKDGNGVFDNDNQPFSGQNYTWSSVSNRSLNTDTTTLTITLGDTSRTLTFVDNSEIPAPVGSYGLCQDHVVLITSTGPIVYSYWPHSLQRKYYIPNWYTYHNTQNTKFNRGAETALTTTWIDLILYTQSPLKQRILNRVDYTNIGDYTSSWRYNVKDNSIWRNVKIIDMNGINILDTTNLISGIYKVDHCVPKWEDPDLSAVLMRINDTYKP